MVVCSAAKIILFSSVYAIACIIMRSFAEWACVFVFKVSNTCGCGRFSSILRIGMVQMFLFHQLKQLYHVVVCVECYTKGPVLCLNQRVLVSIYVQMLVLCVFLLDVFVHLCSKCFITCGDVIFPSIDRNVHVP